jgi:hypothetical protein
MGNEDIGQPTYPINQAELARILTSLFDENGLYSLCFDLGIDYEDLRQGNKEVKVRSLITRLQQHKRIPELVEKVRELRPYFQLNLQRLAHELIQPGDPKLEELDSLIDQFRNYTEMLREWKELHNHLNDLLVSYGQFAINIERYAMIGKPISQNEIVWLQNGWRPIHLKLSIILVWAKGIRYIDKPFEVLESGDRQGAKWAVELYEFQDIVADSVSQHPELLFTQKGNSNKWHRILRSIANSSEQTLLWSQWWQSLLENTRKFDDTIRRHLYLADKELRKSASDLHDLSKGALWS